MNQTVRVIHYVNQFFGGIGGEDKAMYAPQAKEGPVGPGIAVQNAFKSKGINAQIVATVICGDDYAGKDTTRAAEEVLQLMIPYHPDVVLAGPAFNAGRYGVACGAVCKLVREKLGIPAVTAMYQENPGADMYRKHLYIVRTTDSARGMADAIDKMINLAIKLVNKQEIGLPEEENYIRRGLQRRILVDRPAAVRAVDMLLARLKGEPFETELHLPKFVRAKPPAAMKDLSSARLGLVTDGGLVPKGNPDKIEKLTATRYGRYRIEGLNSFNPADWSVSHAGYDNTPILQDPDRLIPLDVLRDMEKERLIGKVDEYFYSTCGCAGTIENCSKMGQSIAAQLKEAKVNAVLLTATWGTSTRCGAVIAVEIERAGIVTAVVTTMTPVALMVGPYRIIPGAGIAHPLGNPALNPEKEKELRRTIVKKALEALQTGLTEQKLFTLNQ